MKFKAVVDNKENLLKVLERVNHSFIVVEGYNGVGKSRVIESLREAYDAKIYRPDYNSWASEIPRSLRWTIFSSILSASECIGINPYKCVIFDRGFFSGPVYNGDHSLIHYYKELPNTENVINILVTVPDEETYNTLLKIRGSEKPLDYQDYLIYTERYKRYMEDAGIFYIEYINYVDTTLSTQLSKTCAGCGHYNLSDSFCKHPCVYEKVSPDKLRCEHSSEREVQDGKTVLTV